MHTKPATAEIDCQIWRDNLVQIKNIAANKNIIAIAKANAYGHGIIEYAKTLSPMVQMFGVARFEEAILLRTAGITKPILLLEGFFSNEQLPILAKENIATVIHNQLQLEALQQSKLNKPIAVWLKIDTGMHRIGVTVTEFPQFLTQLQTCPNVQQPINFISHFSQAEEADDLYTKQQLTIFNDLVKNQPGAKSIAASNGILSWPAAHFDTIRPGIILHGVSSNMTDIRQFGLRPVMRLTASLIAVRAHKTNQSVGYNNTWKSKRDTNIGVITLGYADGYPKDAKTGTPVLINNRLVPIVGKVSMDMITVDLGADSQDQIGDEVLFWGAELPVEKVATYLGVSSYELITRVSARVIRKYINS